MSFDVQSIAAGAAVLFAAIYLARRGWQSLKNRAKSGCGSKCGGCASKEPAAPLLQINRDNNPKG
jgi:hypothetical protein